MHFGSGTSSDYSAVFVGGAPRSGTTLLHALICTSPDVNRYLGECSYLSHLIRGYGVGMRLYDTHTRHYFESRDELGEYHGALVQQVLNDIHVSNGSPSILALKDPLLTARFGIVAKLLPYVQFVVSVRDPRDVIASRIAVYRRQHDDDKGEQPVPKPEIEAWCREFNAAYGPLLKQPSLFEGRLLVVEYERLVRDETSAGERERLAHFGLRGVDPDALWGERAGQMNVKTAWASPLYGQPVSASSIGRHATMMSGETADMVLQWCERTLVGLGVEAAYV